MKESILNRLVERPRRTRSPSDTDPTTILEDIRQDLQNLLNTRNSFRSDLAESFPEAARSILAYGLPDPDDPWFSETHSLQELRERVRQTVEIFEPRVSHVKVTVVESPNSRNKQQVMLEISGMIAVGNHDEAVVWNSILKGGRIEIATK